MTALAVLAASRAAFAAPADAEQGVPDWLAEHMELLQTSFWTLLVLLVLLMIWEGIFLWQRHQERLVAEGGDGALAEKTPDVGVDDPFKTLLMPSAPTSQGSPPAGAAAQKLSSQGLAARHLPRGGEGGAAPAPPPSPQLTELPPEIAARVSAATSTPSSFDRTEMERRRAEEDTAPPPSSAPPAEEGPRRRVRIGIGKEGDQPAPASAPAFPGAPPPPRRTPGAPVKLGGGDSWTDLLKKTTDYGEAPAAPQPAPPPVARQPAAPAPPSGSTAAAPAAEGGDPWRRLLKQTRDAEPAVSEASSPEAAPAPSASRGVPSRFGAPVEATGPAPAAPPPATPQPVTPAPAAASPAAGPAPPPATPQPVTPAPAAAAAPGRAALVGERVSLPAGVQRSTWSASCGLVQASFLGGVTLRTKGAALTEEVEIPQLTREPMAAEKRKGKRRTLAGGAATTEMPPTTGPTPAAPPVGRKGSVPVNGATTQPAEAVAPGPPAVRPPVAATPPPVARPPVAATPPPAAGPPPPATAAPIPPAPAQAPSPAPAAEPDTAGPPVRRAPLKLGAEPSAAPGAPRRPKDAPDFVKSADRVLKLPDKSQSDAAPAPTQEKQQKEIPTLLRNAEQDRRFQDLSRSLREVRVDKENSKDVGELPSDSN